MHIFECCFASREVKLSCSRIIHEPSRRHCHCFMGVQAPFACGMQWPQPAQQQDRLPFVLAVCDTGSSKANPSGSHAWNLLLRKESLLGGGKRQNEKERQCFVEQNKSHALTWSQGTGAAGRGASLQLSQPVLGERHPGGFSVCLLAFKSPQVLFL